MVHINLIRYCTKPIVINNHFLKRSVFYLFIFLTFQIIGVIFLFIDHYEVLRDIDLLRNKRSLLLPLSEQFYKKISIRKELISHLNKIKNQHTQSIKVITLVRKISEIKPMYIDGLLLQHNLEFSCDTTDPYLDKKIHLLMKETNLFQTIQFDKKWVSEKKHYEINFQAE